MEAQSKLSNAEHTEVAGTQEPVINPEPERKGLNRFQEDEGLRYVRSIAPRACAPSGS
jgi:hypothetical protein